MGTLADKDLFTNKPGPKAGPGLAALAENQAAILELPGALPEKRVEILDGAITPTQSALVVDTEGGAPSDQLTTIATTVIHTGAEIALKSADASRKVALVHGDTPGGIQLLSGQNVDLSPVTEIRLRERDGMWFELSSVRGDGVTVYSTGGVLSVPVATEVKRGLGRAATQEEIDSGVTGETGPAWVRPEDLAAYVEAHRHIICEFYPWRHPTLKPGFQPAQGGLITDAATRYPEAWAYLQTSEGQLLCKTEAEWQALTRAIWATLADGTKVGWNGIGGAPWYVQDLNTGTIRLPDLRGMYMEAAGFDSLGVGGVHGWGIPNFPGRFNSVINATGTGPFYRGAYAEGVGVSGGNAYSVMFDPSRVVPVANKVQPRAWGGLACVYLGLPR